MAAKKKNMVKDAVVGAPAAASEPGDDGAEVAEERTEVVRYAAAIDVAKGFGMVCTRVPGSRADRRRQKVWRAGATYDEVVALMDHLRCEGIQRLVLESTSDYWRIWYYLAEAAGLQVWLVNAKDVKHLPGRTKSDREDCVWLCKLNERGMLRRSFVPPEAVRDLRSLTWTGPGWPKTRSGTRTGSRRSSRTRC
jgi:transposase